MDKRAENEGNSSKRRKLSTSKYLHKTRFEEGRGSDVKIIALNREWNLHKIFLEKSPYFQCMFSGPWIETAQKEINLKIEDVNITTEALHRVFESLYIDDIQIEDSEVSEVIPILACATLFQLDDLIDDCTEVMKACINMDTALLFYEASDLYGIKESKNFILDWLHRNIQFYPPTKLSSFSVDLMKEIFSSPEICMTDEESIFLFLCFWMFLKENTTSESYNSFKDFTKDPARAFIFFKSFGYEKPFLETDLGIKYQPLFRTLRLKNLILYGNIEVIQSYNIIPKDWFIPVFQSQWYHVSRICKGTDKGPNSERVSEEEFNRECVRESGFLSRDGCQSRICFDFGFGLGFKYKNGCFYIMRKHSVDLASSNDTQRNLMYMRSYSADLASSNDIQRNLMYRITFYGVDNDRRVLSKLETGLEAASLTPFHKRRVLTVKPPMTFPIQYRINFLLTTPLAADSQ